MNIGEEDCRHVEFQRALLVSPAELFVIGKQFLRLFIFNPCELFIQLFKLLDLLLQLLVLPGKTCNPSLQAPRYYVTVIDTVD
ncbi:MAG: hypothetical protein MZV63_59745 [Marinilabiliales bacterium]|nr:hypothetical protein [Marinilabiliales bacterium]